MAIRAELLLAVPVCLINSSYTLRLLFSLSVLLCGKLDLWMQFRGQIWSEIQRSLSDQCLGWKGLCGSCLALPWWAGGGQEQGWSLERLWSSSLRAPDLGDDPVLGEVVLGAGEEQEQEWSSGAHHCMLQIWEMIPFLGTCREGGAGWGTEAQQSLSSSEIRAQLVQHTFPTQTSCCHYGFMALLEAAVAFQCVSPLWSCSSHHFCAACPAWMAIVPSWPSWRALKLFTRVLPWACALPWAPGVRCWEMCRVCLSMPWVHGWLCAGVMSWAVLGSLCSATVAAAVMYCNDQLNYTCEKSA